MENYKQKHKEDLETAKGWLAIAKENDNKIAIQILENLFPELAESEDEKIRKAIIETLGRMSNASQILEDWGATYEGAIAWLEKQGEQKQEVKLIFPKFRVGDRIFKTHNSDINKCGIFTITKITEQGYWYNDVVICAINEEDEWELEKQKPTEEISGNNGGISSNWSEEDERMFQSIINDTVQECLLDDKQITWLKSLKDKVFLQPKQELSEKDEMRLNQLIDFVKKHGLTYYASTDKVIDYLKSLKNRVLPQPKQEWSEDDEKIYSLIYSAIKNDTQIASPSNKKDAIDWLKSLKPQKH